MQFSIGEVAERTNLPISTLRYYDKEGLLPCLKRDENDIRVFDEEDLGHLQLVEYLKATDMPLKDIKQFFEWYFAGDATLEQRQAMFHERREVVKKQMEILQYSLDNIEYKCWIYDLAVEAGSLDGAKEIAAQHTPKEIKKLQEKIKNPPETVIQGCV